MRLDTEAPSVRSAAVTPDPFSPNGDGRSDFATLAFVPTESATARVSVIAANGAVLRRLTGWRTVTAAVRRVRWDGRVGSESSLKPAPEGSATLLLELRDGAGNTAVVRRTVVVDRTLKLASVSRATFSPNGDGIHDAVTLSFSLTRGADVTATVVRAGSTVRTMRLGRLAAGARMVTWDGLLSGGAPAASGGYSIKVTADGSVGVTTVGRTVMVDLAHPRLTVSATATARYGATAKLTYTVRDAFSPRVKVSAEVTSATGKTVTTIACGWVTQGVSHVCSWKPRARGAYTVTFRAMDLGGNRQSAEAETVLRVR